LDRSLRSREDLHDVPGSSRRPGVPEAVRDCRSAGIRIVMITGDYPATAQGHWPARQGSKCPAFARPVAEPPPEYSGMIRSRKFGARCPNNPIPTRFLALLRPNANGGLLIRAVDKSPEIGAAVIDDDVEGSAHPRLILDAVDEALMRHAVAFNLIRIVVGAGQDLQQVRTADDADHKRAMHLCSACSAKVVVH
jgi:hypothetical protein